LTRSVRVSFCLILYAVSVSGLGDVSAIWSDRTMSETEMTYK